MAPSARSPRSQRGEVAAVVTEKYRLCVHLPLKLPLDSALHAPGTAHGHCFYCFNADGEMISMKYPLLQLTLVGAKLSRAAPGRGDP